MSMWLPFVNAHDLAELEAYYILKAEDRQLEQLARQSEAGVRQMED